MSDPLVIAFSAAKKAQNAGRKLLSMKNRSN